MTELPEDNVGDQIITVKLPRSQYIVLRRMIEDQEAADGVQRWLRSKWIVFASLLGTALTAAGLYEFFKRFP